MSPVVLDLVEGAGLGARAEVTLGSHVNQLRHSNVPLLRVRLVGVNESSAPICCEPIDLTVIAY